MAAAPGEAPPAGRREELIAAWEASPHRAEVDAGTVHFVGWAYLHAGRPRKAAELAAERLARPDTDEASAADLLELQASIAFYAGDNDAAERLFTALLERARATGAASPPQRGQPAEEPRRRAHAAGAPG